MSKRWRSNSKRFKSPDNKRRKQIESDSKLINLDETRKRRKEAMAKSSLNFRYYDSDKSLIYKTQRRTSEIHQRTNVTILDELIKDDVFTESDWSEEDETPVFNISILDIYKKAELTDDNNNIFKWVSKYFFNDSRYCYEQRKMANDHIVKNDDIFSKYLQDQPLTRYVEKMRPGNSSGGKLELIGLGSLFEINIIVFFIF